jgi:hypothetical protein
MKKFVQNILILILPFAVTIAFVNFYVDPDNVFSSGDFEKGVADILLKGHNVDNLKNCDERVVLKKIITQLPYKPDIVSIGSSRSLQVSSIFFPGKRFFNCSLSHANIKDLIAVVGLLDSSNKLPNEVYFDTSPIMMNASNSQEWESIYQYYLYGLKKMNIESNSDEPNVAFHIFKKKCTALFSFSYLQNSILRFSKRNQNKFKDVDTALPKNFGRLFDFSVAYPKEYQNRDTVKAVADAKMFAAKTPPPKINLADLKILKQIIIYLKSKGVRVTLVNAPFQPDCYKIFDEKKYVFNDLANGFKQFAMEMELPLIGTFNPADANLNRRNFWDQIHCDKPSLMTVMKIVQYNPQ